MDPLYILKLVAVAAFGLALGSYGAAQVYRLPRKIKTPRSACPSCGHMLAAIDLVPVFSWVWLRGKCRYCAARISPCYMFIEIGVMVVAVLIFIIAF